MFFNATIDHYYYDSYINNFKSPVRDIYSFSKSENATTICNVQSNITSLMDLWKEGGIIYDT